MRLKRSRGTAIALSSLIIFSSLVVAIAISHKQILWQLGAMQVNAETPRDADIIVVLGGDALGRRILKGAELAREGYAPKVLVSGAGAIYGFHESTLAIAFAKDHGYASQDFLPFQYPAANTLDEAKHVVAELRKRGVHKYLVVTSPNHTARAGRIFRRVAPDLEVHVVACNDGLWNGGYWWKRREGEKLWFTEELKTFAEMGGL